MIKKFNNFINESVRDLMKGKSKDEVMNSLDKLSIVDKFDRACEYGLIDVVKTMLKTNKDDINMEDAFETAVIHDQINIAKLLVSNGVDIELIYANRMFDDCIENDDLIKFKFLLDLGFDILDDTMYELAKMNALMCLTEAFKRGYEMEYYEESNLDEDKIDDYFFAKYSDEVIKIILKNSEQIRTKFEECANEYIDRAKKIKSYLK